VLVNPGNSNTEAERSDVQAAAKTIGRQLIILDARNVSDIEAAFATFVERGVGALFVGAGSFMTSQRDRLIALAGHHRLPASFITREAVNAGGLMSYGPSQTDGYRQVGIYAGRILKGETPAELPVMQSVKFEFVLNLRTAKALGLEVPPTLLRSPTR
jgi:putative ABC transport system substrate-binding protein